MGRVTTKFAVIQQKHFRIQGLRNTGKALLRKMITQVWDISWTMWEHRNFVLHKTMTPRKQAQLDDLRQKVREEFAKGTHGMAMKDSHYLDPTKKEWALEQDLEDTATWLQSVRLSRALHTRITTQATPPRRSASAAADARMAPRASTATYHRNPIRKIHFNIRHHRG